MKKIASTFCILFFFILALSPLAFKKLDTEKNITSGDLIEKTTQKTESPASKQKDRNEDGHLSKPDSVIILKEKEAK